MFNVIAKETQPATPDAPAVAVRLAPATERASVAATWQALEARLDEPPLTCSWAWTETWLEHYGDAVPHRFLIGEAGGQACGLALLTQSTGPGLGPWRIRRLHLGTAGEPRGEGVYVEYNRLLVLPEHRQAFARGICATIRADAVWERFCLDGFAPDDAGPLLEAAPELRASLAPCATYDLASARAKGGDVLEHLKPRVRHEIRRSLRGLGKVVAEWAETDGEALEMLRELADLHQQRWQERGQPGAFASRRFLAFHQQLVTRLWPEGAVILFRVRGDGGTIGCLYCFVERGRVLFYQSGLAAFDDPRIKPGLVCHALLLQACLERGYREYDFLAGQSRYKQDLSTTHRTLVWASAQRRTPRTLLVDAARLVRRSWRWANHLTWSSQARRS